MHNNPKNKRKKRDCDSNSCHTFRVEIRRIHYMYDNAIHWLDNNINTCMTNRIFNQQRLIT